MKEDELKEQLERQKDKLSSITLQDLDEEQLNAVSGGGNGICDGAGNCDEKFKLHTTIPKGQRCKLSWLCDEAIWNGCFKSYMDISPPEYEGDPVMD